MGSENDVAVSNCSANSLDEYEHVGVDWAVSIVLIVDGVLVLVFVANGVDNVPGTSSSPS